MGLDAFIFKISAPELPDKDCYTSKELDFLGLFYLPIQDMTEETKNNLRDCVKECLVENSYYDLDKIRAEYMLSEHMHIGTFKSDGSIVVVDRPNKGTCRRVPISKEEIQEKFVFQQKDTCYVFQREIVKQLRSDYEIGEFFDEKVGPIANTSYYPIDEDLAAEFNEEFDESIPEEMPEGTGLFYYEWF